MDFVILLVEDDPNEVLLIKRALSRANLVNPLRVVRDGDEAISYFSEMGREGFPRPSLIFLDLELPRRSGLEVLEWIRSREETRTIPVVILTGSTDERTLDRARALGVRSVLNKPVRPDDLIAKVHSIGMYWVILHSPTRAGVLPEPPSDALPGR